MAVAEMSKLRLIGLSKEKDNILNSLIKTNAVQIKTTTELKNTTLYESVVDVSKIVLERDKLVKVIELINKCVLELDKKEEIPSVIKDGFIVSSRDFDSIVPIKDKILKSVDLVLEFDKLIDEYKVKNSIILSQIDELIPYKDLKEKFSVFKNTEQTQTKLGVISNKTIAKAKESLEELENVYFKELYSVLGGSIISITYHNKMNSSVNAILLESGFTECLNKENYFAKDQIEKLNSSLNDNLRVMKDYGKKIISFSSEMRNYKILVERLNFELLKLEESNKFRATDQTFVLEAFVPKKHQEKVNRILLETTENFTLEYEGVAEEDLPPTYMENKSFAKQFEFVTNLYSVPKYKSFDPNAIMGFFFSLFMGMIVADFGYGVILFIACMLYSRTIKIDNGMKRLAKILAVGGLFAIPFGILFDSFMGFALIHKITEIKFGTNNSYSIFFTNHLDAIKSFSALAGISVPSFLLWSMLFGIVHIMVGYILKAIQEFMRGKYFEGVVDGLSWAIFMLGFGLFGFTLVTVNDKTIFSENVTILLKTISLILIGVSLLFGVILSGFKEKGFVKFTKSFGNLYGVINIASDILSYARLYGLMLSGSQIATIFTNTIAIQMLFPLGVVGIIAGVLVIVLGNVFNLAMGVLGAYIHDSRLQYVEFYGKFYDGDGELFKPLGSSFSYISYVPYDVK